jgi:predicted small secreted protein
MMKKTILIITLVLLYGCKTQKTGTSSAGEDSISEKSIVIVNPNEVDAVIKNRAYDLGSRLLESCNTSKFKPFSSEEATDKVIQNATPKILSETCKKINFRNGKYISLDLIDVKHDEINEQYIFKYNINYEKKYFKRELTVTVDATNKVSSISTKEVRRKPM